MNKSKEALEKAKDAGKQVIEGGKKFGKGSVKVLLGTAEGLGYTLASGGEIAAAGVSKIREKNKNISQAERNKRKSTTKKLVQKSGKSIKKAGVSGKKIISGAGDAVIGAGKVALNAGKGIYNSVDAVDKYTRNMIEAKRKEQGENKVSKVRDFFRNNIFKSSIVLALLGFRGVEASQNVKDADEPKKEIRNSRVSAGDSNTTMLIPTEGYNLLNKKTLYDTAPLTRLYLGGDLEMTGNMVINDTLILNPGEALHNLRTRKIERYGQSTKNIEDLDGIDINSMSQEDIESFRRKYPLDATYLFVVKPYTDGKEEKETMSLDEFVKQTNKIVSETRDLTKDYVGKLTGNKKELFDAIRNDISGEAIVAYSMTELCESKRKEGQGGKEKIGEFNKQLFDFLLKNSGANFLSKVPALYDKKTSYGLYQFTEFALYDVSGEKRGASIVNRVLPPESKIPGSVIDLKTWQDQTKAAYMFAIQNINSAVDKLSNQQVENLLRYHKTNRKDFQENITILISMCHHMPVANSLLGKRSTDGCERKIYDYNHKYRNNIEPYGMATLANYEALIKPKEKN